MTLALLTATGTESPAASPKLAAVFGDAMVLQRDAPVPIWGTATPGERVTVHFAGQSPSTQADGDGRWRVELSPLPASAPAE